MPTAGEQSASSPAGGPGLSIAMLGTRGLPAGSGGVERAVEELSARLVQRGHRVTVYGRRGYADPAADPHRGIRHVVLAHAQTKHLEAISHTALATARALRERHDVLHFHATGPGLLALAARARRVPSVVTVQGLDWQREKWGPVASGVLRAAARSAAVVPDETIVVSRGLERAFTQMGAPRISYIPNGVDLDAGTEPVAVEGIAAGSFALFLGRLVPEKGVTTLLEAYRSVPGDAPLLIVGESSHSEDYVARVRALAEGDPRVRLLGERFGGEKLWLLQNARLFVQPSTVEGLPIALLEALAHGAPTLVSDLPENLEPVTSGGAVIGASFRRGDTGHLAAQLTAALAGPRPDGGGLRRHVRETYDWDGIAAEVEAVYRRAMSRRATR